MSVQRHTDFAKEVLNRKKESERLRRAEYILIHGIEMPSCSSCAREGVPCVMAPSASRCSRCTSYNTRCSNSPPTAYEWERLLQEDARIDAERDEAVAQQQRALQEQLEASSRLSRLDMQKRQLRTRGAEMLRRGLYTLDELEEAERREREAQAAQGSASLTSPTPSDALFSEFVDPPPEQRVQFSFDSPGGSAEQPASQT